ncbi:unnamed protein product [Phytomonas sp. EM1]|nr:unnamed protein product [Phytomonas sp. EM1]|eukprot:CCW63500.1 unnamed protein product [Phytomonas sp. isolate EM1]
MSSDEEGGPGRSPYPNGGATPHFVVWSGEWPYVKQGVSQVRTRASRIVRRIREVLDIDGRISAGKSYTGSANALASSQMQIWSRTMREKSWGMPAIGVVSLSLFVTSKSTRWGTYVMFRNGIVTATILTLAIFPREIVGLLGIALPPPR